MTIPATALDLARQEAKLSQLELWLRYFGLGGMTPAIELEAIMLGLMDVSPQDRDVIAHALNERFTELGQDHPVPYSEDVDGTC